MHPATCTWKTNKFNAIVGLTSSGTIASDIITTTFFTTYVEVFLPMMQPFDGISPNSILIMDNSYWSIHHVSNVKEITCQLAIVLLFQPCWRNFFIIDCLHALLSAVTTSTCCFSFRNSSSIQASCRSDWILELCLVGPPRRRWRWEAWQFHCGSVFRS